MICIMRRESFEKIAKMAAYAAISGFFVAMGGQIAGNPALADPLDDFATAVGLRHGSEFHRTVTSLRHGDGLPPDLYVSKREAQALGWRPGADLCPWLGGRMIGGDPFDNRERALPAGGRYREADLDEEDCGHRGPRRLLYDAAGDIWVSLDHYRSVVPVP